ncbi:MAG: S1C family serine protease, partial [Chitinophagaceae bacterium]
KFSSANTGTSILGFWKLDEPKTFEMYIGSELVNDVWKLNVSPSLLVTFIPKLANGFLVTSAHVLKGAKKVYVQNIEGKDFLTEIVHEDQESDIALLKINDADFTTTGSLPYGFSRKKTDLSEPVFTLGFPKDEIVYNEGYLSAQTGLEGDTMSCQITITANPGNSGGPVFNKNGEVIGILNARQASANGVVFATKSKNIYHLIESLKESDKDLNIRMKANSSLKGSNRSNQVKKVQDHIYMVKVVLG